MSGDQEYPVVHTWLFTMVLAGCAVFLVLLLTACAGAPVLTEVKVPVPVACQEKVPDRPAMPTDAFTAKPTLDQYVRAARSELERRQGYEEQLRIALEACTEPIK